MQVLNQTDKRVSSKVNKRKQLEESYRAIEILWTEIEKRKELPDTAVLNLPTALSRDTQAKLAGLGYDNAILVLKNAIETVNNGAVRNLDELVNEEIEKTSNMDS